jgi:hypothetical protein
MQTVDTAVLVGTNPPTPTSTVTIDQQGVELRAVGSAIISPDVSGDESALQITAPNVEVSGLTIDAELVPDAAAVTAVEITGDGDRAELSGLVIQGDGWDPAISVDGESARIQFTTISGLSDGPKDTDGDGVSITTANVTITDSTFIQTTRAIELIGDAGGASIREGNFFDNFRAVFSNTGSHELTQSNIDYSTDEDTDPPNVDILPALKRADSRAVGY